MFWVQSARIFGQHCSIWVVSVRHAVCSRGFVVFLWEIWTLFFSNEAGFDLNRSLVSDFGFDCFFCFFGVTIFVDRCWACGGVVVGSVFDFGVCLREVWRGESLGGVVDFGAILWPKGAPARQCASRKNAW